MLNITNEQRIAIMEKFKDVPLKGNLTELNWWQVIVDNMTDKSFRATSGVSKCVFLFEDFPDIVVKIPFTGCGEEYDDDISEDDTEAPRDRYEDFSYAEMGCGGHTLNRFWDYCEAETVVYRDAVDAGVDFYFAETMCIGFIDMHPIYIQERATIYYDVYNQYGSKYNCSDSRANREKVAAASKGNLTIDDCWLVDGVWLLVFTEEWGESAAVDLITFLLKEGVDDLHCENLGFIDNKPVIIDYSSFND